VNLSVRAGLCLPLHRHAHRRKKMDEKLKELNLLVLYLSGWEEDSRNNPGQKIFRSWKGYLFEVLNDFEEKEFIIQNRKSKSVVFTETGKGKAEEIKRKYF